MIKCRELSETGFADLVVSGHHQRSNNHQFCVPSIRPMKCVFAEQRHCISVEQEMSILEPHVIFVLEHVDGQCFQRYSISHFSLPSYVVAVVLLGQIRVNERISESFPANYIIPCAHGTMNLCLSFTTRTFALMGFP